MLVNTVEDTDDVDVVSFAVVVLVVLSIDGDGTVVPTDDVVVVTVTWM